MSERFNFYDIYGYLLPGVLLLALLWLPFGLLLGHWPPPDLGSAVLALGLAYIVGHLIHALSKAAFSSKFKDDAGNKRHPSDLLVSKEGGQVLPSGDSLKELKCRLAEQIERYFAIQIDIDKPWTKELGKRRNDAFLKCRSFLVEKKAAVYLEQQQGMYALMRGIGTAFVLACALYLGIAIGALLDTSMSTKWMFAILLIELVLTIPVAFNSLYPHREEENARKRSFWLTLSEENARKLSFWMLALVLLCSGMIVAKATKVATLSYISLPSKLELNLQSKDDPVKYLEKERALLQMRQFFQIQEQRAVLMFVLSLVTVVLIPLCLSAFRAFAVNFAATVYRDFSRFCDTADHGRRTTPPTSHQIHGQGSKSNGKADE